MMTLAEAASYFDRTPANDPDTDSFLFNGQLTPYDDSKRDAGAAYRRVLSVAPGTSVPGAVRMLGRVWLVGAMERDALDTPLRDRYVLQPATASLFVGSLDGYLRGAPRTTLWCALEWLKNAKEIEVSSDEKPIYTLYVPAGADLREHDVVWDSGRTLLAQAPRNEPSGYAAADAYALDSDAQDATLTAREYDPVGGAYFDLSSQVVKALSVRWQDLYRYGSHDAERHRAGDITLVLPAGTQLATCDTIAFGAVVWRPLTIESLAGAVVVHARAV